LSIAAPGYSDGRCQEVSLVVSTRSRWLRRSCIVPLCVAALSSDVVGASANGCIRESDRVRARQLRIAPGVLAPGPLNAITDVEGVRVGQMTLIAGDSVRTGATAILPHGGNLFQNKVPAAVFVFNGFGKSAGLSQVAELGEIETPIVLTNTLAVARGVEAILDWTLAQPGNEKVMSVNAVVGETNDGTLNDIRARALTSAQILEAIKSARAGPVEEGAVGAGTGTVAFGWKGGIGTSSRRLPGVAGGWTVGVLVQTNFGGVLTIDGRRVGEELGKYYLKDELAGKSADGSIMVIVATDAPLSDRNLARLARRAVAGIARTGSSFSNGSGDYVIGFSTAADALRTAGKRTGVARFFELSNDSVSPLLQGVAEATEEAIYNSLFMATTTRSHNVVTGKEVVVERLPLAPFLKSAQVACP
jgi:D-aminopeptidase